jgi:hypothetical protein
MPMAAWPGSTPISAVPMPMIRNVLISVALRPIRSP